MFVASKADESCQSIQSQNLKHAKKQKKEQKIENAQASFCVCKMVNAEHSLVSKNISFHRWELAIKNIVLTA